MTVLLAFLLLQAAPAPATLERGAEVFKQSCAVGYCHGSGGSANRAPRLAGRSFAADYVFNATSQGLPGTAMPAFGSRLSDADLRAVVAYVMSLGTGGPGEPAAAVAPSAAVPRALPAHPGRDLFFDATRAPRCGTCHVLEERGVPVGPNLAASPPASVAALRSLTPREVRQARSANGDAFPALPVATEGGRTQLYDLTATPPSLRTLPAGQVTLEQGAWAHSGMLQSYTDAELEQIVRYIRLAAGAP
jgi:mono/diheme cytochrome c family protein